jgi:hypothetical protein
MISDVGRIPNKIKEKFEMFELMSRLQAEYFVHNILGMRGNIAGFIVALTTSVIMGIVILVYMVNTAKEVAGNDTEALAQIDKIVNIGYIAMFFAGFIGFVVAARYILDIISGGNKGEGGM